MTENPQQPQHDPASIRKVETFVDSGGRQINALTASSQTLLSAFHAVVYVTGPQGTQQVPFKIEAVTIEEAFAKFDGCAREAVLDLQRQQSPDDGVSFNDQGN